MKKVILTGERPTGRLHIGHYFGALKQRVELQDEYDVNVIIADVQALTDNYIEPDKVRRNVREVVLDNLAVGIDPEKSTIFIQSMIPEIAELTAFYSNLVTVARLYRNPTVKTEAAHKTNLFGVDAKGITYGFLGYPVSQAADITIFDADLVPVGDDQIPMIEQTRELVEKFNNIYGKTFKLPEYKINTTSRIKGLDGNDKMGKSLGNAIYLADSEDEIRTKVMKAVTDTNKIAKDDPANPDVCMVYYYHKLFSEGNLETITSECKAGKRGCVDCKKELIKNIVEYLAPIQRKRKEYDEAEGKVEEIIANGTAKAREKAKRKMTEIKKAMCIDYEEDWEKK